MDQPLTPVVNSLSRPFWEGVSRGHLLLPFCSGTARSFWPPSPSSPFVTGGATEWRETERGGVLKSVVSFQRSFHPAFASVLPYAVGLVELDAGPRLRLHLGRAATAPQVSERVEIVFAPLVPGADAMPIARSISA